MALSTMIKDFLSVLTVSSILTLSSSALAVSSSNPNKVKDFKLRAANGKIVKRADVSMEIRRIYSGVRPKIVRRASGKAGCYDAKFVYKSKLRRVSFNCTTTRLVMHAKYLR